MDIDQCRSILRNTCEKCESDWIALSGGLDSSIIANLMKKEKTHAITIITKDFVGTDPVSYTHLTLPTILLV